MANISIRVPDDIKKQAADVFAELGLDMSTAINLFPPPVYSAKRPPIPSIK